MIRARYYAIVMMLAVTMSSRADGQGDTLRLESLQSASLLSDPRASELDLLREQTQMRLGTIATERLPVLSLESFAQYQSDVARFPITIPGMNIPTPPHDTYDARVNAQQLLYDPTYSARRNVENAQLDDAQARLRTILYARRRELNEAYFSALLAQERIAELQTGVTDLEAQLRMANSRVTEGTATPSEEYAIRAELLRRRQLIDEAQAGRRAAFAVLSSLTRQRFDSTSVLAIPADNFVVAGAESLPRVVRPELAAYRTSIALIEKQRDVIAARDKPRISAFGRAGYGRPGLNPLANSWDSYYLAGIQLQWSPFNWGKSARERRALALSERMLEAQQLAFVMSVERQTAQDREQISRLARALSEDDEIIALREKIFAEAAAKYREAAVTSDIYVDKQTDVIAARIARASHRVELARAKANLEITLGVESKQ